MLQQVLTVDRALERAPIAMTVVIPTLNEVGNVEVLLERLGLALARLALTPALSRARERE